MNHRVQEVLENRGANYLLPLFWQHGEDEAVLREEMARIREAGVVIERNLCTDSAVGIIVEEGANAIVRANRTRNVTFPMARPKTMLGNR